MFSCLHPRRPGAGRPLPNSTPPDNLHPCRPPLHRVQLLRYLHARGEMTPTAEVDAHPPPLLSVVPVFSSRIAVDGVGRG
ncbi:hypothetical protein EE612_011392 [Oryza sativa]|nr:hypothetical protein EE612_011392 [Oryza sativa]